jgi:hypothetical protein
MKIQTQQQVKRMTDAKIQERIQEMRKYLNSSKFHQDTTIQVWEVQRFISEINYYIDNSKEENIYTLDTFIENLDNHIH